MPFYRDFVTAFTTGAINSIIVPMCSYAEGDLLIAELTASGDAGVWTAAGWEEYHRGAATRQLCIMHKIATASEPSTVTFTCASSSYRLKGTIISVGDVNTATPFDVKASSTTGGAARGTMPTVTTTGADRLIFYFLAGSSYSGPTIAEGNAHYIHSSLGSLHDDSASWGYQKNAGASPSVPFLRSISSNEVVLTLAINPPAAGAVAIPAYTAADLSSYLTPFSGGTFNGDAALANTLTTDFGSTLAGATLLNAVPVQQGGYGVNPSHYAGKFQGGFQVATYAGCRMQFATANKPNISGKNLLLHGLPSIPMDITRTDSVALDSTVGVAFGLCSTAATNYKWWHVGGANTSWGANRTPFVIHSEATDGVLDSLGTLNDDSIYSIGLSVSGKSNQGPTWTFASLWALGSITIAGGNSTKPITLPEVVSAVSYYHERMSATQQGSGQAIFLQPIQFGDGGTNPITLDLSSTAIEFPAQYDKDEKNVYYNSVDNFVGITYYAGPADVINHSAAIVSSKSRFHYRFHPNTSTNATYNLPGLAVIGAGEVTLNKAIPITQLTINDYITADLSNLPLTNCTILGVPAASDSLTVNASTVISGCTLDVSGVAAGNWWCSVANPEIFEGNSFTGGGGGGHAMKLTAPGSYDLTDNIFTGFGADGSTGAAIYNDSGGAITLYILGSGNAPTVKNGAGATTEVIAFQSMQGLDFSGVIAGSTVKIFATGTQTVLATPTGPDWLWSETYVADQTVDYTILLDEYIPIRVAGLALSDAVVPVVVQQVEYRAWQTPSGLIFDTTAFVNATTKKFGITVATTVQNWASFLVQSWRTEATLANVSFPVISNGPNSFAITNDWAWDLITYPNSISLLSQDGMRYINSSGLTTKMWAALLSVGVPAGMTVLYQQADGSGTTSAQTTGNIDQLIQIYEAGVYDKRGQLVLKAMGDGYDQASFDAVAIYGTLEDQFYVASLQPVANGITGQAGITGITITDHGASPVTWNGKEYSITITDNAAHTGEEVLQYIRDLNNFNYHDLVQAVGTGYVTVRGEIYGDAGATIKGVRVLQGTEGHLDFISHMADDGTSYIPPVLAIGRINNLVAGSRVQIYNMTTAAEMFNDVVAGTSYSTGYSDGTGYSSGDVVRVTLGWTYTTTAKLPTSYLTVATSTGWSILAQQETALVYERNGINGFTVNEFTADYGAVLMNLTDLDGVTTVQRGYAWYIAGQMSESGIRYYHNAMTAEDEVNYRINVDVVDLHVKNIVATPAMVTGGRLYRSDGSAVFVSGAGPIEMEYGRAYPVETGVSGLTALESDKVMAIPTNPVLATDARLNNLDVAVSTRLAAGGYTAPDNAGVATALQVLETLSAITEFVGTNVTAIKTKTDNLPNNPASAGEYTSAIAAIPTNPVLAANYTAPDNVGIATIKAVTDALDVPTAGENATAVRTELALELAITTFLLKSVKNKREIKKIGAAWWLLVYDDDGTTEITSKELQDLGGNPITDLAAGQLAQELASVV